MKIESKLCNPVSHLRVCRRGPVQKAQDLGGENTLVHVQQRLFNLSERPAHARQLDADVVRAFQVHYVHGARAHQASARFGGRVFEREERLQLLEVQADVTCFSLVPDGVLGRKPRQLVPVQLLHAHAQRGRGQGGSLGVAFEASCRKEIKSSYIQAPSALDRITG